MKKLIQMIEDESIADKHWSLKGEVTSKSRPLNSLLEEDIDFEHASKVIISFLSFFLSFFLFEAELKFNLIHLLLK